MKQDIRIVSAYGVIHFAVDFSCIAILTGIVMPAAAGRSDLILCVILYNAFAFAFQLPVGLLGDILNKNALLSAFGCLLTGVSWLLPDIRLICVIAGIGNACFHVGGGIDVLNISGGKATLPGLYVAPGALGVFLGNLIIKKRFEQYYLLSVFMIACAAVLIYLYKAAKTECPIQNTRPVFGGGINPIIFFMAVLLFATVLLRSYMGSILNYGFKAEASKAALFVICVVLGKAFGGIAGDRFGWLKTGAVTLSLSAVLFALSFKSAAAAMAAVFLFNMTMPITLTALANSLSLGKGFAFGLTTFALFLGAVPIVFGVKSAFFHAAGLFGIAAVSAVLLTAGLKLYDSRAVKRHD